MFVKGAKFPKGGPNFLGNMAPGDTGAYPKIEQDQKASESVEKIY